MCNLSSIVSMWISSIDVACGVAVSVKSMVVVDSIIVIILVYDTRLLICLLHQSNFPSTRIILYSYTLFNEWICFFFLWFTQKKFHMNIHNTWFTIIDELEKKTCLLLFAVRRITGAVFFFYSDFSFCTIYILRGI